MSEVKESKKFNEILRLATLAQDDVPPPPRHVERNEVEPGHLRGAHSPLWANKKDDGNAIISQAKFCFTKHSLAKKGLSLAHRSPR